MMLQKTIYLSSTSVQQQSFFIQTSLLYYSYFNTWLATSTLTSSLSLVNNN